MDAVVTAGGIPQPDELLYPYTLGKPKAMLDICGKPMVQWVLDALSDAKRVDRVVLIVLAEESGVTCTKPLVFIPNEPLNCGGDDLSIGPVGPLCQPT